MKRPRFSLRTLVLFVCLAGSGVGLWWRWEPWIYLRQEWPIDFGGGLRCGTLSREEIAIFKELIVHYQKIYPTEDEELANELSNFLANRNWLIPAGVKARWNDSKTEAIWYAPSSFPGIHSFNSSILPNGTASPGCGFWLTLAFGIGLAWGLAAHAPRC